MTDTGHGGAGHPAGEQPPVPSPFGHGGPDAAPPAASVPPAGSMPPGAPGGWIAPGYGAPPGYGQPGGYVPPGYGQPAYGYGYPVARGTNGFAIAALICAFACSPLGIIFGFVAKSQIKQTGESGDGLATAGIVVGAVFLALLVVYFVVILAVFGAAVHNLNNIVVPTPVT